MKALVTFSVERDKAWILDLHMQIGHPETKLLTKQNGIILLNLLSFSNCFLGHNLFHKWEFSSSGSIMCLILCQRTRLRTTYDFGWAKMGPFYKRTCNPGCSLLIPDLTGLCVVFKSHPCCSRLPLCSCSKRKVVLGTAESLGKSIGELCLDKWLRLQISCL